MKPARAYSESMLIRLAWALIAGAALLLGPAIASAHEVYVLPSGTINEALGMQPFNMWQVVVANLGEFTLWAFIAAIVIFVVFFVSVSRGIERLLDPWLAKLPRYAPAVSRITVGISFIAAAYYQALFGPELPLAGTFGASAPLVTVLLLAVGVAITVGWYARVASLAVLALFAVEIGVHGVYMLTYTNYFAELLILVILGAHILAIHHKGHDIASAPPALLRIKKALTPYAFLILRVGFGISLFYASLYAKILHNNLALDVAYAYPPLVHFFGFEPHFLVLGAALIEMLIASFFILGIEIRFTSLFLLFWLTLSLIYFGEVVWPHVILIGIPIGFIFYGYDKYSLEGWLMKRGGREPVL